MLSPEAQGRVDEIEELRKLVRARMPRAEPLVDAIDTCDREGDLLGAGEASAALRWIVETFGVAMAEGK